MRPLGTRELRRERRRAWRGFKTGRRARTVKTTPGRGQMRREWDAPMDVVFANRKAGAA